MFTPTNPQNEQMRAQAILSSLTEYEKSVDLFVPAGSQGEATEPAANANPNNGLSIMKALKSLKLNRDSVVEKSAQDAGYPSQQVTWGQKI